MGCPVILIFKTGIKCKYKQDFNETFKCKIGFSMGLSNVKQDFEETLNPNQNCQVTNANFQFKPKLPPFQCGKKLSNVKQDYQI